MLRKAGFAEIAAAVIINPLVVYFIPTGSSHGRNGRSQGHHPEEACKKHRFQMFPIDHNHPPTEKLHISYKISIRYQRDQKLLIPTSF